MAEHCEQYSSRGWGGQPRLLIGILWPSTEVKIDLLRLHNKKFHGPPLKFKI